jgi:hypothetical protein
MVAWRSILTFDPGVRSWRSILAFDPGADRSITVAGHSIQAPGTRSGRSIRSLDLLCANVTGTAL